MFLKGLLWRDCGGACQVDWGGAQQQSTNQSQLHSQERRWDKGCLLLRKPHLKPSASFATSAPHTHGTYFAQPELVITNRPPLLFLLVVRSLPPRPSSPSFSRPICQDNLNMHAVCVCAFVCVRVSVFIKSSFNVPYLCLCFALVSTPLFSCTRWILHSFKIK